MRTCKLFYFQTNDPKARTEASQAQLRVAAFAAPGKIGGAYRDRTGDPLLAKQVLSQLS